MLYYMHSDRGVRGTRVVSDSNVKDRMVLQPPPPTPRDSDWLVNYWKMCGYSFLYIQCIICNNHLLLPDYHPLYTCTAQTRIIVCNVVFVLFWDRIRYSSCVWPQQSNMFEVIFHVFNIYSLLQILNNYTIMMVRI